MIKNLPSTNLPCICSCFFSYIKLIEYILSILNALIGLYNLSVTHHQNAFLLVLLKLYHELETSHYSHLPALGKHHSTFNLYESTLQLVDEWDISGKEMSKCISLASEMRPAPS